MASSVSVSVPTWLTFTSTALASPFWIPCWITAGLVTNRSSPTSCTRPPRRRVGLAQPVLDRHDGIAIDDRLVAGDQFVAVEGDALTAEAIPAVVLGELAGRDVQRQRDVVAGTVAGALDGLHEEVEGGGVAAERRREAALVAQPRAELLFLQGLLEGVEDLDGDP